MGATTIGKSPIAAAGPTHLACDYGDTPDTHDRQAVGTVLSPICIPARRVMLRTVYFPCPIDLNLLRSSFPTSDILSADPLVLSMQGNAHVVVLRFGAVVFWHCSESVCNQ